MALAVQAGNPVPIYAPATALNLSGVGLNAQKMSQMPQTKPPIEPQQGYREVDRDDESSAEITWRVPWTARHAFREWAKGYSAIGRDANGNLKLSRTIPAQHPEKPWLFCVECEVTNGAGALMPSQVAAPVPPGSPPILVPFLTFREEVIGAGSYGDGFALMKCVYRDRPYDIFDDATIAAMNTGEIGRYVIREPRFSLKGMELPQSLRERLVFDKVALSPTTGQQAPEGIAGIPIPGGAQLLMPLIGLSYLWLEVPLALINWSAIQGCLGHTNANAFDLATSWGGPWAAQTLLMQSPEIRYRRNGVGIMCADIRFKFDFVKNTWNAFPAADGNFYFANFGTSIETNALPNGLLAQALDAASAAAKATEAALPPSTTGGILKQPVIDGANAAATSALAFYGLSLTAPDQTLLTNYINQNTGPVWIGRTPDMASAVSAATTSVCLYVQNLLVKEGKLAQPAGSVIPPTGNLLYPTADFDRLFKPPGN